MRENFCPSPIQCCMLHAPCLTWLTHIFGETEKMCAFVSCTCSEPWVEIIFISQWCTEIHCTLYLGISYTVYEVRLNSGDFWILFSIQRKNKSKNKQTAHLLELAISFKMMRLFLGENGICQYDRNYANNWNIKWK